MKTIVSLIKLAFITNMSDSQTQVVRINHSKSYRCYIVAQIYVCKINKIISITYYPNLYVFANESMNIKL